MRYRNFDSSILTALRNLLKEIDSQKDTKAFGNEGDDNFYVAGGLSGPVVKAARLAAQGPQPHEMRDYRLMDRDQKVSIQKVAREFCNVLRQWLTGAQMTSVVERNVAEVEEMVCHSHDYCDANMAMLKAYCNVFGIDYEKACNMDIEGEDDPVSGEKASRIQGMAWTIAKWADFDPALVDEFCIPNL